MAVLTPVSVPDSTLETSVLNTIPAIFFLVRMEVYVTSMEVSFTAHVLKVTQVR